MELALRPTRAAPHELAGPWVLARVTLGPAHGSALHGRRPEGGSEWGREATMTALGEALPDPDRPNSVPLPGPVEAMPTDMDADVAVATLAFAVIAIDSAGVVLGVADVRVLKRLAGLEPETVAVLASILYRSVRERSTSEHEGTDGDE